MTVASGAPTGGAHIVFQHNPFDPFESLERLEARPGATVAEILAERGIARFELPTVCTLNGRPLLRGAWHLTVPRPADTVAFLPVLQGGGGGGGSKNPLRTVLMVAVLVASAAVAPALGTTIGHGIFMGGAAGPLTATQMAIGKAIAGAVIGIGGSMVVNALVPVAAPAAPTGDYSAGPGATPQPSPTYSLDGQGNQARLGQPKPVIYGRHRIVPDFASQPWTHYVDNEQYLHSVFVVSQGEVEIEAKRIGNTDIANFQEVEEEIVEPGGTLTLFDPAMTTALEVAGQTLLGTNELAAGEDGWLGPFPASNPETSASSIHIDTVAPRGLYYANNSGGLDARTIDWVVEARPIDDDGIATGDGSWTELGAESWTLSTNTPQRRSDDYVLADAALPDGRYEVRVRRTNTFDDDPRAGNELQWHGLRARLNETPDWGDVTLYAVRMRATNNLSARSSREVNLIATRKLPIWDKATQSWSAPTATRSIAWALADVARAAYGGRQPDSRLDLDGLADLDALWAGRGEYFDAVFDSQRSVMEAMREVAQVGRAVPVPHGTRLRVVRDGPASLATTLFSERNIMRGSFSISYLMPTADTADAVTAEYMNPKTWKPAEVTVRCLDGPYQEWLTAEGRSDDAAARAAWTKLAEEPVRLRLFGCTDRTHARRWAWYTAQANAKRRRETRFETEAEGLLPAYGDLAAVAHGLPRWGESGEVVRWTQGEIGGVATLSEPVTFDAGGGDGAIAFGDGRGGFVGPYACAPTDAGATVTQRVRVLEDVDIPTEPDGQPYTGGRKERTPFAFGPSADAWSVKAKLLRIAPSADWRVQLRLVIDHPDVYTDPPAEAD
jgi:hypothetical protein